MLTIINKVVSENTPLKKCVYMMICIECIKGVEIDTNKEVETEENMLTQSRWKGHVHLYGVCGGGRLGAFEWKDPNIRIPFPSLPPTILAK